MRTYLYGLILARNAHLVPPHIAGIHGATLSVLPCDALSALVSEVESASSRDLDALRAHDHAVQAVVHHGTTATAVRFGQTFSDATELRQHLAGRASTLAAILEELDGCVEMRLLMTVPPEHPAQQPDVAPGRAYLEKLRGSPRTTGLALQPALGDVVRAERVEELPNGAGVSFAHLIRREHEQTYRDAVASQPSLSAAKLVGPLALYAFAEGVP